MGGQGGFEGRGGGGRTSEKQRETRRECETEVGKGDRKRMTEREGRGSRRGGRGGGGERD